MEWNREEAGWSMPRVLANEAERSRAVLGGPLSDSFEGDDSGFDG